MNKTIAEAVQNASERFWKKADTTGAHCWPWNACLDKKGYGRFAVKTGVFERSHRVAWILDHGEDIPNGLCVLHACDNPRCVRPNHLWIGTKTDNNIDRTNKGRAPTAERHWKAKINTAIAHAVREGRDRGMTVKELAEKFNISYRTVYPIVKNITWRHA